MAIKIQAVVSSWKKINIDEQQQELDETASLISEKQDESDISRKKLVDQVKEFRKNTSVCKSSAALIKSFQNEIDFLSKRSKFSEIAFLKLYQKFLDIVDPVPSLEYCMVLEKKLGTFEDIDIENKSLKETLKDYNEELKEVRNQDITIKNLKDTIRKYDEQLENAVQSRIKCVEKDLILSYSTKEQLFHDSYDSAINKVKESEKRCQILQQSSDQTQSELFDLKSKFDYAAEAKLGEIELLSNDIDRANQQAAAVQKELANIKKENELLSEAKESTNNDTGTGNSVEDFSSKLNYIDYSALEAEISGKDKEISQLIEEINNLQISKTLLKDNYSTEQTKLVNDIEKQTQAIDNYEKKLLQQKDYDEVKRELAIIKSIEFDSMENLNSKTDADTFVSKPLELLLLEKNKTLQKEITSIKLLNKDLSSKFNDLEKCDTDKSSLLYEQTNLISQLESDLLSMQKYSNDVPLDENTQLHLISEALKDISIDMGDKCLASSSLEKNEVSTVCSSKCATSSLLSIVSAQRERFRIQNDKLESEFALQRSQMLILQNELDTLRGDNIKLYEKIRFLQSYQSSVSPSNNSFIESRYSDQYESSLDPFISFSQKEKQTRYISLSPFEKVTLSFGQFVLKNKRARTATFAYLSILHILVFLVLYKFALTESYKRDFSSECAKKFAEHMHDVHGES